VRGSKCQIITFIGPTASRAEKAELLLQLEKSFLISHNHADLPPLVSIQATGICIPLGNTELLAAVYKPPGHAWNEANTTGLLNFRHKSVLAGDLNSKHPVWNSAASNYSGEKLLELFDINEVEILAPECPTHYRPAGNCGVLDILVHQNVRLSDSFVT
jgi:hypothetical protein